MKNIYINDKSRLKMISPNEFTGYLVLFGGKDLSNEAFSQDTDFGFDDFKNIPIVYNHGYNDTFSKSRIGEGIITKDEFGVKLEAELFDKPKTEFGLLAMVDNEKYREYLEDIGWLIKNSKMGLSSGAVGHLVDIDYENRPAVIKQWFIGEASLTPTPAEPNTISKLELKAFKNYTNGFDAMIKEGRVLSSKNLGKLENIVALANEILQDVSKSIEVPKKINFANTIYNY